MELQKGSNIDLTSKCLSTTFVTNLPELISNFQARGVAHNTPIVVEKHENKGSTK